jgi:hypothetical protein
MSVVDFLSTSFTASLSVSWSTFSICLSLSESTSGLFPGRRISLESTNQSECPVRVFWLHLANLFLAVTTPSQFDLLGFGNNE